MTQEREGAPETFGRANNDLQQHMVHYPILRLKMPPSVPDDAAHDSRYLSGVGPALVVTPALVFSSVPNSLPLLHNNPLRTHSQRFLRSLDSLPYGYKPVRKSGIRCDIAFTSNVLHK